MGGVVKTIKKTVKDPLGSVKKAWNNPIINPIQSLGSKAMSLATGRNITNVDQMKIGAMGGGAITGARALGLIGGARAAVPGALGGAPVAGAAGGGGNIATAASAMTPTQQIVGVAKAAGMSGMQKLQMAASLGLLGAGIFGQRAGEAEQIWQSGDDARANSLINELATEQEVKRKAYLDETRAKITARRAENVAKMQGRLGEQTRVELPKILEELNSRGLLTSESAVANAMAQKQAENALTVQDYERAQGAQDAALEDQISQDILEGRLGMEQAALQRQFSLQDTEAEARLAQALAKRRARTERDAALIQGGSTLLGSALLR